MTRRVLASVITGVLTGGGLAAVEWCLLSPCAGSTWEAGAASLFAGTLAGLIVGLMVWFETGRD